MGCPREEVGGSRCDGLEDGSAGDGVEGVGDIDLAEKPSRCIRSPRDEGLDGIGTVLLQKTLPSVPT